MIFYSKEKDFRNDLKSLIEKSGVITDYKGNILSKITKVESEFTTKLGRIDIAIFHDTPIEMKWHKIPSPFVFECKLDRIGKICEGLLQTIRYKSSLTGIVAYEKYPKNQLATVIATPYSVFNGGGYLGVQEHDYVLKRVLWHLGIGSVEGRMNDGRMFIKFNENEMVYI
jgi:hypothetical protein